jgi:histidinol dehydrogenase
MKKGWMQVVEYPSQADLPALLKRPAMDLAALENVVKPLMQEVKTNGDKALQKFTLQFDKIEITNFKVDAREIANASNQVSEELKQAIKIAAENITRFHSAQKENVVVVETQPGVKCWRKSVGIEKVGLYIPGG